MHAGVVHDTSAVLTGTRWIGSSGGLIDGGGGAYDDLMLTWNIAALPNSTYQYTYTLTSREEPPLTSGPTLPLAFQTPRWMPRGR